MHCTCLALKVGVSVLAKKKKKIGPCCAVDFFYRYQLGIDRLWNKRIIFTCYIIFLQISNVIDLFGPGIWTLLIEKESHPSSRANYRVYEKTLQLAEKIKSVARTLRRRSVPQPTTVWINLIQDFCSTYHDNTTFWIAYTRKKVWLKGTQPKYLSKLTFALSALSIWVRNCFLF